MDEQTPGILRITYASLLSEGMSLRDVDDIIAYSAERNAKVGITGILAIEDGKICQIIEGPEDAVAASYERIERDPRHTGVVMLDRRTMPERSFAKWAMTRRPMFDVVMVALNGK